MVENVITTFEPERKRKWWQSENGMFLKENIAAKCYCEISLRSCLSRSCLREDMKQKRICFFDLVILSDLNPFVYSKIGFQKVCFSMDKFYAQHLQELARGPVAMLGYT